MAKQADYVRYTIRVPADLYAALQDAARDKSINAEIIARLEASFAGAIRVSPDLKRRIDFFAKSNGVSLQEEITVTLENLYPEIPQIDEILDQIELLLNRTEKLELGDDKLMRKRVTENLNKLHEHYSALSSLEKMGETRSKK